MQVSRRKSRGEDLVLGESGNDEGKAAAGDIMKTGRVSLGNILPGAEVRTPLLCWRLGMAVSSL